MDMYPEARVILTTCPDAETWAESCFYSLGFFFTRRFFWAGMLWETERLWYKLNIRILEWSSDRFGEGNAFSAELYEQYNRSARELARERGREILEFKVMVGRRFASILERMSRLGNSQG